MRLHHEGDRRWCVRDATGAVVAELGTDDLRYSVSWKAYCFADEDERAAWEHHADDLELGVILDTLLVDLRRRGVLAAGERPSDADLGKLLIETYVEFPAAVPA